MEKITLIEFAQRLDGLIPLLMRGFSQRYANQITKGKITFPQLFVLDLLWERGSCKMGELAAHLKVSMPAATGIVEHLVRQGYCRRSSQPQDRRIVRIEITAKGRNLLKDIRQKRRQMIVEIFGKISAQDRSQYLNILTKIKDILFKKDEGSR